MDKQYARKRSPVTIGRHGENKARQILFDISRWKKLYGSGTVALLHRRCGDIEAYPCLIEIDGNFVVWTIMESDLAKVGQGQCELQYLKGETVVKSEVWVTKVNKSLTHCGNSCDNPQDSWVTKVLQAGAAVLEAQMHPPMIGDNGNWLVWSSEESAYKDTGISAGGYNDADKLDVDQGVENFGKAMVVGPDGRLVPAYVSPVISEEPPDDLNVGAYIDPREDYEEEEGVPVASGGSVRYDNPQNLSEDQKRQARENIGAFASSQGEENAEKLLFVDKNGIVSVLAIGAGLAIVGGKLTLATLATTTAILGTAKLGEMIL